MSIGWLILGGWVTFVATFLIAVFVYEGAARRRSEDMQRCVAEYAYQAEDVDQTPLLRLRLAHGDAGPYLAAIAREAMGRELAAELEDDDAATRLGGAS